MQNLQYKAIKTALQWYIDNGVDEVLVDQALDRTRVLEKTIVEKQPVPLVALKDSAVQDAVISTQSDAMPSTIFGKSDARVEAVRLAKETDSLDALRSAVEEFDGFAIKKTATHMVFSDGGSEASIMLIGESPGADEDRQGRPFVGVSGALLDRILACIDISREPQDGQRSIYLSNLIHWRPPGNRALNSAEIDVSLPFIEKHIMLVQPKILIFCGGVVAKALLDKTAGMSKLRSSGWHEYRPVTEELGYEGASIPAIVTHHPESLLRTPAQKRAVWSDMLRIQEKLAALNL